MTEPNNSFSSSKTCFFGTLFLNSGPGGAGLLLVSKVRLKSVSKMNYSNNTHINKCVNELAELLNPENNIVTRTDVDRAIRLLRPSKGSTEHTTAIRARIRQTILNQCGESNPDGQLLLNKFEKQCDLVRKVNPNLLSSFLAILQPLSFRAANSTQVKPFVNLTERKNNTDGSFSNFATGAAALSVESKLDETIEEQTAVDSRVFQSDLVWVTSEVEHLLLVDLIYVLQVRI